MGEIIEMQPEFSTMSRRPGIGLAYYERWKKDFFPSDFYIRKGSKIAVPKYYLDRLEESDPEMYQEIKDRRRAKRRDNWRNYTPQRLEAKEKILQLNAKHKERKSTI